MVGFVIATHGKFAEGLVDAANLIMGEQEQLETVGLCHGDSVSAFGDKIVEKVKSVNTGDGVVIFTDLFGASPNNQSAMAHDKLKDIPYKLITGVNLPMLVEAVNMRLIGNGLNDIATAALASGQDGIKDFFAEMEEMG